MMSPPFSSLLAQLLRRLRPLALVLLAAASRAADRPPNVVLLLTDDQGALDLHSYGAKDLQTPNIDALGDRGLRFAQFYAGSSVCSPARASILTGRSPQGAALASNSSPGRRASGLPSEQVTIAEMLKSAGYATAQIGKWHLGDQGDRRPVAQGFDYSFGFYEGCTDNYSHFFFWSGPNRHDLWENGKEIFERGKYLPDLMVDRAGRFIAAHRDQPFFIYYAMNQPHYPMQPAEKWANYYRDLPMPRRAYAACVSTADERIGELVEALKRNGVYDNTVFIFLADQGYSCEERAFGGGGYAGPMRGAKFDLFEGGIRVPALIAGPGIPAGGWIHRPAMAMDLLPTIAELCGVKQLPAGVEGKSLVPMFRHDEPPHPVLYWKLNRQWAVREGDWKLLVNPRDDAHKFPLDPAKDKIFLANLQTDLSESHNLAADHPEIVDHLVDLYRQWQHCTPEDLKEAGR
jgi:arylsulfatase A-like enzyme